FLLSNTSLRKRRTRSVASDAIPPPSRNLLGHYARGGRGFNGPSQSATDHGCIRCAEGGLSDLDALAAVDRQKHPGDELRLIGSEEHRCVCHIPRGSLFATERDHRVASGDELFFGVGPRLGGSLAPHSGIHPSRENGIATARI